MIISIRGRAELMTFRVFVMIMNGIPKFKSVGLPSTFAGMHVHGTLYRCNQGHPDHRPALRKLSTSIVVVKLSCFRLCFTITTFANLHSVCQTKPKASNTPPSASITLSTTQQRRRYLHTDLKTPLYNLKDSTHPKLRTNPTSNDALCPRRDGRHRRHRYDIFSSYTLQCDPNAKQGTSQRNHRNTCERPTRARRFRA